jgi:hypothetical protein
VPTKITIDPNVKPAMTKLRDLTKQMHILGDVGGAPSAPELASVRATYLRCCELWQASMAIAAAIVANDNSFTAATLDALKESDAP